MQGDPEASLNFTRLDKHNLNLTSSQKNFVEVLKDWIQNPRKKIVLLSGGPGTGKTFVVSQLLNLIELQTIRMAWTARSANHIKGRTIHSTVRLKWGPDSECSRLEKELVEDDVLTCIEKSQSLVNEFSCQLNPDIVVIDEVGMINVWIIYWLIHYFMEKTKKPLLFVLMGDRHQLHPVSSKYNVFFIVEHLKKSYPLDYIHLLESKRFVPEYDSIINQLRELVDLDDTSQVFDFVKAHYPVYQNIDNTMLKEATRAMAFKNSTVLAFNEFYLHHKIPGRGIRLYTFCPINKQPIKTEYLDVKPNCLIFVTQNNFSSVSNGTSLVFKQYNPEKDNLICTWEKGIVTISRNEKGKFPIEIGFAGTLHKFQGQTLDEKKIIISFDGNEDLNLIYTALSRVRSVDQILAVKM